MKKVFLVFALLCILPSSFGREALTFAPSMTSTINDSSPWESYAEWQCFSIQDIQFECAVYTDDTTEPSIVAKTQVGTLFFDVYSEDELNCDETLNQWRALVADGKRICILAAQRPNLNLGTDSNGNPNSLWYLESIKGKHGYWDITEHSAIYSENENTKATF